MDLVQFSCYRRRPYLDSAAARDLFQRSLETMRARYDLFITGYVAMPEHVHLLVGEPKKSVLAKSIQALKLSVAVQRSERPFWQPRYYDFNVFTYRKCIEKLRYIHRNPVRRGLVGEPEAWGMVELPALLDWRGGAVEIESPWTAARRDRAGL